MSDDSTVYKYSVPLTEENGASKPMYAPSLDGELYERRYKANALIIVQDDPIPHFHKDSVNVVVEKVDKNDYK